MRELGLTPTASRSPGRGSSRRAVARRTQAGLDFYDRLVDELLARGHRAVRHALPLGSAAGARGRGRLGRPRHRRRVRRVRRGRRRGGSATGSGTGSRTTSRGCIAWLGYGRGVHAPGRTSDRPTRSPRRTTCCSRTGGRSRSLRREAPDARGRASRSTSTPVDPASATPEDVRRPAAVRRRAATAGSSTRSPRRAIRPTCSSTSAPLAPLVQAGDLDGDRGAARLPRRQLLPARASSRARAGRRRRRRSCRQAAR